MDTPTIAKPERSAKEAMKKSLLGKCPNCGKGHLFQGYLKTVDKCSACDEAFHHHRADDAPPYITMAIVGHVIVGLIFHLETSYQIEPYVHLLWSIPSAIILSLLLLRPIKGMVVGLQWANYLHGFDPNFSASTDMQ